jgi:predicted lipase
MKTLKRILSSVHIALDDYDDIFSDFDISPYNQRALSKDFLDELKTRVGDGKVVRIVLSLPKDQRNVELEREIKTRLREAFAQKEGEVIEEIERIKRRGMKFLSIGLFFLASAVYFQNTTLPHSIRDVLVEVITTPLGWFFTWTGLSFIIEDSAEWKRELAFYTTIKNATIEFIDEEEVLREE